MKKLTFKTKDERFAYIQGMIDAKQVILDNYKKTIFLNELLQYLENHILKLQCEIAWKDYGLDLASINEYLKSKSPEEIKQIMKNLNIDYDYTVEFFENNQEGTGD